MSWRDVVASPEWLAAVEASIRTVGARVEVVDGDGVHQADLPIDAVRVTMRGESAEMWGAAFSLSHPLWVPLRETDLLDPRAGMSLRVWWRVLSGGVWLEVPVGTYMVEDPEIDDDGVLSYSLDGVDPLAEAKRGGYGGATLDLGGVTVTQALRTIFQRVAPRLQIRIPETSMLMPAVYTVGAQEPATDWTDIAAMAGWIVRTDREGVIQVGPTPEPSVETASWQEADPRGCVVLGVKRSLKTSSVVNRVVCTSTSTEIADPIREVVEDDDPGSATWVGAYGPYETEIRSDKVTTAEGARNMARAMFERWRKPMETVTVRIPPRPDLSYGDLIAMGFPRSGVAGVYRVSSWSLTLSDSPSVMEVTMMARATV